MIKEVVRRRYAGGGWRVKQTAGCWLRAAFSQAIILLITWSHCFVLNLNPSDCHVTQHQQRLWKVPERSEKVFFLKQLSSAVLWENLLKYRKILTADPSESSKLAWREKKKYYLTLKRRVIYCYSLNKAEVIDVRSQWAMHDSEGLFLNMVCAPHVR